MKTVGILGGMGPLATSDLFNKIVTLTDAKDDNDHIHIILNNYPIIPDRTNYILGNGENPIKYMIEAALKLQVMGSDVIIMPCNTAHYFYEELTKYLTIPFINMIEETAKEIKKTDPETKKICLLSTQGTYKAKVYDNVFENYGLEILRPEEAVQNCVTDIIYSIKKGDTSLENIDKSILTSYLDSIKGKNIILGCTELPVAFDIMGIKEGCIDPTKILAKSAIRFAGKNTIED
ncbi:amino acid racemase [uncultured Ilyobacter sp.]|uniref:amino acid racemase n=1 Tax=uncultured Ilyobacter sp. TaxID=544433 RepID=UPI0029C0201C|nr:amino acid racemase [uncultured Ilyobacter sp.]